MQGAGPARMPLWMSRILPGIALLLSLLLMLVAGEVILRALGYGNAVQYDYVPLLRWVNRPNQTSRTIGGWSVRINSQGFRSDEEYSYEKARDELRILIVGDSFTFGYGVAQDSSYPALLEQHLRRVTRGCTVQVLNAGVNGYNTKQEVVFVQHVGVQYHPDVVIVGFTPNDVVPASEARTTRWTTAKTLAARTALYHFLAPRLKALLATQERRRYTSAVAVFLEQRGDPLTNARWQTVRAALQDLVLAGPEHQFVPLVVILPIADQVYAPQTAAELGPQQFFGAIRQGGHLAVLDVLAAFREAAQSGQPLFLDEPTKHPNPAGHAIVSDQIARYLAIHHLLGPCKIALASTDSSKIQPPNL